jgi:hypothetical protein
MDTRRAVTLIFARACLCIQSILKALPARAQGILTYTAIPKADAGGMGELEAYCNFKGILA